MKIFNMKWILYKEIILHAYFLFACYRKILLIMISLLFHINFYLFLLAIINILIFYLIFFSYTILIIIQLF